VEAMMTTVDTREVAAFAIPASFVLLMSVYSVCKWYMTDHFQKTAQIAWVFTLVSSTVTSMGAAFALYEFYLADFDPRLLQTERWYAQAITIFFLVYLILDLSVGYLHYPDQIGCMSGWGHHIVYTIILTWALFNKLEVSFLALCALELPTIFLSLGYINKRWRNDILFGVMFFVTRIVYHAWMIYYFYYNIESTAAWLILLGIYPMHIHWFGGWIRQQKRKCLEKSPSRDEGLDLSQSRTLGKKAE
jgi:hypothetical protein